VDANIYSILRIDCDDVCLSLFYAFVLCFVLRESAMRVYLLQEKSEIKEPSSGIDINHINKPKYLSNMGKKRLFILAIICTAILVASLAVYFQLAKNQENSWLAVNDFVVYQQDFAWATGNTKEYMFWNITALSGNTANIQLSSHGVQVTNGTVDISSTVVNLKIDIATRKVVETSDQTGEMPVGSIFPLWISQSVKEGDSIQTSYGAA
jgi:hypothetical protein